jgi:hypothetical protein
MSQKWIYSLNLLSKVARGRVENPAKSTVLALASPQTCRVTVSLAGVAVGS